MTEDSPSLLRRFRADRKRLPLHPLERAFLAVLGVHLCFLPWALGTMHAWSQATSLALGLVGLILALLPRTYAAEHTDGPTFRLNPWPRLLKFPLFWIGLVLLAYIVVQSVNPSWVYESNATSWWLRNVDNIAWLPTSIEVPYPRFNLWRQFIIYAAGWVTVCSLWVGITRRRSLEVLLLVLLFNALALVVFGGVQFVTGQLYLQHLLKADHPNSGIASFVYHNHAGAYLALLSPIALAFACRHWFGPRDQARKSTPAPVLLLVFAFVALMVVLSQSRGATLTLAAFSVLATLLVLLPALLRQPSGNRSRGVTLSVALLFAGLFCVIISWVNFDLVIQKFGRAVDQRVVDTSIHARVLLNEASYEYWRDYGIRGMGAGAYRYYFPLYQENYPELVKEGQARFFFEHAHNDWLQIPIELGAFGVLLLITGAGWCGWRLIKHLVWTYPPVAVLVLGCGQTLVHAWFDFPFQCPAILTTWLVLVAACVRWLELEEPKT